MVFPINKHRTISELFGILLEHHQQYSHNSSIISLLNYIINSSLFMHNMFHISSIIHPIFIWLVVWNIFYFSRNIGNNDPNWLSFSTEGWLNHQAVIIFVFPMLTLITLSNIWQWTMLPFFIPRAFQWRFPGVKWIMIIPWNLWLNPNVDQQKKSPWNHKS